MLIEKVVTICILIAIWMILIAAGIYFFGVEITCLLVIVVVGILAIMVYWK